MPPPMPKFSLFPVHFHYLSGGNIEKSFLATCAAVPRVGEVVFPESGSRKVIVHVVTYRTVTMPGGVATMIPNIFLREPTPDEEQRIGWPFLGDW